LNPDDLIAVCAGLVVIETESKIIRLVHFTTEEFFRSSPETLFPNADVQLSKTCLAYLSFDSFRNGCSRSVEDLEARAQRYPFLLYAAVYWQEHYRGGNELLIEKMALNFLKSQGSTAACGQMEHLNRFHARETKPLSFDLASSSILKDRKESGLHIASAHGLHRLVVKLLDNVVEVDKFDDICRTPLVRATEGGNESVVRLLLDNGADVDSKQPNQNRTPLSRASKGEDELHESLAEQLSEKVAEIDPSVPFWRRTPLCSAAIYGHESIVQLLLKRGAEVDLTDQHNNMTPLACAAFRGHTAVVKLLLENGAQIDWKGEDGTRRTPLTYAVEKGHNTIVEVLLKEPIDLNTKDDINGFTPLMWACRHGRTTLAKLLLDKGADVNLTSSGCFFSFGPFGTAFGLAAKYGHQSLMEELLVHGTDKYVTDGIRRNALHYAGQGGHLDCVNAC
jgi:ankyrin repeat protein